MPKAPFEYNSQKHKSRALAPRFVEGICMQELDINGKIVRVDVDLDMTGTKFGCGIALCGAYR